VGYQVAIVNFNSFADFNNFKKTWVPQEKKQENFPLSIKWVNLYQHSNSRIPLIPRFTITTNKEHELKKRLNDLIKNKCLISVDSTNQQVLEVAARDGRVDMLNITSLDHIKALSKGIVSLCKQNTCIIDLNSSLLLNANQFHRSRILREYYRLFSEFKPYTHLYSVGSYAELLENQWLIRGPREIMHMLTCLFEIPLEQTRRIVKDNIEDLVLRFIKRDQDLFIEPGVEVVDIIEKSENPKISKITEIDNTQEKEELHE
jgi:RNase P/RNase MRP subunit p30